MQRRSIGFSLTSLDRGVLGILVTLSLTLNLLGNSWGAPQFWHPDEITPDCIGMISARTVNPHEFQYGGLTYYIVCVIAVIPVLAISLIFDAPPKNLDSLQGEGWKLKKKLTMIPLARSISAAFSVATVIILF